MKYLLVLSCPDFNIYNIASFSNPPPRCVSFLSACALSAPRTATFLTELRCYGDALNVIYYSAPPLPAATSQCTIRMLQIAGEHYCHITPSNGLYLRDIVLQAVWYHCRSMSETKAAGTAGGDAEGCSIHDCARLWSKSRNSA